MLQTHPLHRGPSGLLLQNCAASSLALFGAKVLDAVYRHRGKLPPIDYTSVEMATYFWYLDDSKARRELGFETRDPGETLYDTVSYLRENFLGGAAAFA